MKERATYNNSYKPLRPYKATIHPESRTLLKRITDHLSCSEADAIGFALNTLVAYLVPRHRPAPKPKPRGKSQIEKLPVRQTFENILNQQNKKAPTHEK